MVEVGELKVSDYVQVDHEDFDGDWRVADVEKVDIGITEFNIATIVQDDEVYSLIGPQTHPDGKTVQIRTTGDEEVADISPEDVTLL